jgi:death-on-curing protein
MRFLTLAEVVELHRRLLRATGGASGIRDLGALESAIAQPKARFGGVDLYLTLVEKAAALCLALVQGHAFLDAPIGDQERVMLELASGRIERIQLAEWLRRHVKPLA